MLLPWVGGVADIPKTMIFVDSMNKSIKITMYLCSMLDELMRKLEDLIVWPFAFNLRANTKVFFMEDFRLGNTRILVCTDAAGIGVDVQDVKRSIQ